MILGKYLVSTLQEDEEYCGFFLIFVTSSNKYFFFYQKLSIYFVFLDASFRIVGGREIEITDAPYIVRIYDPVQGGVCGGTILSERVVITAAHCINLTTAGQLLIRAGSKLLEKESTDVYRPRKLSVHTSWDRSIMAYDIALITVNKDFIFSDSVKKAELPAKDAPVEPGTVGKVSGWGTVDKGYPFPSNRLKQAEMTVLEQSVCEDELLWKRRKLSGETVFCAAGENYESSTCKVIFAQFF